MNFEVRERLINTARPLMAVVADAATQRFVLCVEEIYDKEIAPLRAALDAILAEPYGCVFCDSGKLRNPKKDHDIGCGYAMARRVIG